MKKTALCKIQKQYEVRISVIMPVYNTPADFLKQAIESILSQTFADFELLIIDDASTADIFSIISLYSDDRIKYFKLSKNGGAAGARNFGIEKARGEFIAFLDSDDIAEKNRLEKQIQYLDEHKDVGCLASCVNVICNLKNRPGFPYLTTNEEIQDYLLFKGCAFCQSSVMLRSYILRANKLKYDDYYIPAEDYKLWLDIMPFTKYAILPEKLVQYRFYAENISNKQKQLQNAKCVEAQLRAVAKLYNLEWEKVSEIQKFLIEDTCKNISYQKVNESIAYIFNALGKCKKASENLMRMLRIRYKKHCYHTRSLKGQFQLLKASIFRQLGLPLYWQIFCFITRGIL